MSKPVTDIYKALGDPTRLSVIDLLLADKAMGVDDMIHNIGIEPTLFSHHLKILRDSDLIVYERIGKRRIYSISKDINKSNLRKGKKLLEGLFL